MGITTGIVTKTTVVGRYAVVLTRNGSVEGSPLRTPLFVEHFGFGWQPVDFIHAPCQVRTVGMTPSDVARLEAGVPNDGGPDSSCASPRHDVGAATDVEAVRRLSRGPLTPFVAISGAYGFASWYGAGGGEEFFEKRGNAWRVLGSGGGALTRKGLLTTYGIPESASRVFGIPASFAMPRKRQG